MFSKVTFALSHELTNLKTAKESYSLFTNASSCESKCCITHSILLHKNNYKSVCKFLQHTSRQ